MSRSNFLIGRGSTVSRNTLTQRQTILPTTLTSALYLGGNDVATYITPSSNTPLNSIGVSGSFSCGALVNLFPKFTWSSSNDNDSFTICDGGFNYGLSQGYTFQVTPSRQMRIYAGQNTWQTAGGIVPFETWVWLIYVLNGNTITFYLNGTQVGQNTSVTRVASSTTSGSNFFGTESAGTGSGKRRLKGMMSYIFSMSSPLIQSQINDIVFANKFPSVDILYYCNEGTGNTVYDKSGNTNNGALGTGAWTNVGSSIANVTRTNLCVNPSFEALLFWAYGSAGTLTGITYSRQDTTYVLSGTYAATYQANFTTGTRNGQYYLTNNTAYTPIMGHTYTFSAYVYLPSGSPITSFTIAIRDYTTYNYISSLSGSVFAGQWTRLSVKATATATYTTWRFTIADPIANGYTGNVSWWVDNTMIEDADVLGSYFDGSSTTASWTGTASQSTSILPSDRISTM